MRSEVQRRVAALEYNRTKNELRKAASSKLMGSPSGMRRTTTKGMRRRKTGASPVASRRTTARRGIRLSVAPTRKRTVAEIGVMRQDKSAAERVEEMIKETQNSNKKVHVRRRSIDLQLAIQSEDTDNVALQAINKARRMSLTEVMTESKRDLLKQEDEKQKGNLVKKISLSRMAQLKVKIKMIGKMALLMKMNGSEQKKSSVLSALEKIGQSFAE